MKRHTSRIITQQCSAPALLHQGSCATYAIAAKGAVTVSDATLQQTKALYDRIAAKDPEQKQFLQAFSEVTSTLLPVFERNPKYLRVMETLAEPEQVHTFRVAWLDDKGNQRVNRGFRVQFNSAIGPYKGGLRLHPSVNLSIIKFLGFEQVFKNSLTSLPMGGGKGGSDFDPKGKSDNEVMRFCQSFMNSLHHYIGPNQDVPAGDIGVGAREIGYLFGQYKHLTNRFEGVLTGKSLNWGGSLIRPEATGYGAVYFAEEIMKEKGLEFKGKKCLISGSGNVAEYCAEKLLSEGAKVLTLSDSDGFVYEPNGFTNEQLDIVRDIKKVKRERISEYAKFSKTAQYYPKEKPWKVPCDLAFPCATENEIDGNAATTLAKNGCLAVIEGANMPSTNEAVGIYHANKVLYAPAKAANAGGVATSGLEMSQNSIRLSWTREEVDARLRGIMRNIFKQAKDAATEYGQPDNIQMGANIAGFLKVADSMIDQGCL